MSGGDVVRVRSAAIGPDHDEEGAHGGRDVVVVGQGLIGAAVRDRLHRAGHPVIGVCRTRPADAEEHWTLDLASASGRQDLAADIRRRQPKAVILVHGPSDVTWCDTHPGEAVAVHGDVAEAVSRLGVPVVLVSTDNVFGDGELPHDVHEPVAPGNAYGRAKLAAERALSAAPEHVVVRVSLVYGWTPDGYRPNFGERCLLAAATATMLQAPEDQSFTPIHVDDVAAVLAAVAVAPYTAPRLLHLAGPELLSRAAFARTAYDVVGAATDLVRPVPRAQTAWASRPPVSALKSSDVRGIAGLHAFAARSVRTGLADMWTRRPERVRVS